MDNNVKKLIRPEPMIFGLQSLIDSHTDPFVVIDNEYCIVAVNKAYEDVYGTTAARAIGQHCHQVSHQKDTPCHLSGEDCPHEYLFSKGERHACMHVHYDAKHCMHQVRVTAYPLYNADGVLYMGELIQPMAAAGSCECEEGRQMVGKSLAFMACVDQLKMVAAADAPVLLQGETGTGKELAASFIHEHSQRCANPYLAVDCTTLSESLFEAEVFGHTKGAYTGSVGEKQGLFDQANGGTLFLDEVGELPLSQQAKLLRILETGQYRRVGGRGIREVNVRIVCATNRHLWEAVTAGTFREDLYYRIACLTVRLPSLRERIEDIPVLVECLLEPVNQSMGRRFTLLPEALDRLKQYHYPGNVRELRNILFIAATHSSHDRIGADEVDKVIHQLGRGQEARPQLVEVGSHQQPPLARSVDPAVYSSAGSIESGSNKLSDAEARHISGLLEKHGGNRRLVAAELGISERTLYRKLKKFHLS